jgi:hypothetical protein
MFWVHDDLHLEHYDDSNLKSKGRVHSYNAGPDELGYHLVLGPLF